jgi:hypothetical protein
VACVVVPEPDVSVVPDALPASEVEVELDELELAVDDCVSLACSPQAEVTARDAVMRAAATARRHRRRWAPWGCAVGAVRDRDGMGSPGE